MYVYIGNVKIRNRFFLLVEIEVEVGNVAIEEFVFIRISEQEARTLLVGVFNVVLFLIVFLGLMMI